MSNRYVASTLVFALLAFFQVPTTDAGGKFFKGLGRSTSLTSCDKFKLRITKLEDTCQDTPAAVTFENVAVELTPDCFIKAKGHFNTKGFKTAKVTWDIHTNIRLSADESLTGTADACNEVEKMPGKVRAILESMKLTTHCPMPAGETLLNGTGVDVRKYKNVLWLATGVTSGTITLEYDTGKSCINFSAELINTLFPSGQSPRNSTQINAARKMAKQSVMNLLKGKTSKGAKKT